MGWLTKPQGVHESDWTRAHGENIAHDTAYARRSPLVRFNVRRVIMAFHFKDNGVAVIDIDDACVLAWTLDDAVTLCEEFREVTT